MLEEDDDKVMLPLHHTRHRVSIERGEFRLISATFKIRHKIITQGFCPHSATAEEQYCSAELESYEEEEVDYQHAQGEDCEQQILFGTVDNSEWYDDDDDGDWDGDDDDLIASADCVRHAYIGLS